MEEVKETGASISAAVKPVCQLVIKVHKVRLWTREADTGGQSGQSSRAQANGEVGAQIRVLNTLHVLV